MSMSSGKKEIKKVTVATFKAMKGSGEKIASLTAYDFLTARILDSCGIDLILVGDSAGNVISGYDTTIPVTVEDILYHTRAVRRGITRALLTTDMPFMSYQTGIDDALKNAGRLMKGGAESIKLEGGRRVADIIEKMVGFGIPVMGHLGLTPQSINVFGSYKVRGQDAAERETIFEDAKILDDAGVFGIVLEKIPEDLAKKITETVSIPTIGIGAGRYCDGQILVMHDMLGIYEDFNPKFVRRYAHLADEMRRAFDAYIKDVKSGGYPTRDESYSSPD